jgi:hypothetical protein
MLIAVQPAFGQSTPAQSGTRYRLSDFSQYEPVNALEMVQHVPGFSIDAQNDRRGFGDNAGNVLIDGDRPSTKSDDVLTLLQRIPATQVDYIELSEGAGGDGEARGRAQIVNVVRKTGGRTSGTYEIGLQVGEHKGATPVGKGSVSFRRGRSILELNAEYASEIGRGRGPEFFRDGQSRLIETRIYDGHGRFKQVVLGGSIKSQLAGAKVNANVKTSWSENADIRRGMIVGPAGNLTGTEILRSHGPIHDFEYEIGGDIEFSVAPKLTTKFIGLWRDDARTADTSIETLFNAQPRTFYGAASRDRPDEAIFRVQTDWTGIKNHAIQFGGEIARNRLHAVLDQTSAVGNAFTPIPSSDVNVSEVRFEPFISDVWSIGSAWKLEAGVVYETSKLKLSGDSRASRRLTFTKPRLVATLTLDKLTTLELRAEREVEQLDFADFATSVDLGSGNQVDAGNAELVPERADSLSMLVRRKFLERGSIALKTEYQWVKDTQDLVPITLRDGAGNVTSRFDGSGNIGDSRRWNFELDITLPFDWLTKGIGITGMEVKYTGHYHGSHVTDPVTGFVRRISNRPLWHQEWHFRHDLGKSGLAWGVTAYSHAPSYQYYVDQLRQNRDQPRLHLFVEYKKFKYGTIKLQAFDVTRSTYNRDRFYSQNTRASGVLTSIISRERAFDRRFQLSLSGKF